MAGSSSDYGVQRAIRETTAVTIRTHGSTVSEEKENSKVTWALLKLLYTVQ